MVKRSANRVQHFFLALAVALVVGVLAAASAVAQGGPPAIPHTVEGRGACLACHASGPKAVPADHEGRADSTCQACHSPAE